MNTTINSRQTNARAKAAEVQTALARAILEVEKSCGVKFDSNRLTYDADGSSGKFNLVYRVLGDDVPTSKYNAVHVKNLVRAASCYGIGKDKLGAKFTSNNVEYEVAGATSSKIVAISSKDGKLYTFPPVIVAAMLGTKGYLNQ